MAKREVYPPYEHSYASVGCWTTLVWIAVAGWVVAAAWPWLTWLAILLTVPAGVLAWDQLREWRARAETQRLRARGMKGVLIYSKSPNWQGYIEEKWLPHITPGVEVLDWSARREWREDDVRVRIFRWLIQSEEDYNPAAVVFRSGRAPLVFRFYPAFKNAKHGNVDGLNELEREFFEALGEESD
ncbi:MAG TPA: hypothetical protein VEK57_19040 [Thermoanaerobaculia bacterium]|nr:hypothetical protein [Thermoanaerobaculia bacterium]